jgi:hypothetical protein
MAEIKRQTIEYFVRIFGGDERLSEEISAEFSKNEVKFRTSRDGNSVNSFQILTSDDAISAINFLKMHNINDFDIFISIRPDDVSAIKEIPDHILRIINLGGRVFISYTFLAALQD